LNDLPIDYASWKVKKRRETTRKCKKKKRILRKR